jgi:hypothetical protein
MMNQPLAVLPGGFEVRQSFVPSVGAAQYSPTDPLELLEMCSRTIRSMETYYGHVSI